MKNINVWYRSKIKKEKHWHGDRYEDMFVKGKMLGACTHDVGDGKDYTTYLIKLSNGKKIECFGEDLFIWK